MDLLPPPPPPPPCCPPPCWKTPHPAVPSRAAPARPVPPTFRKSRRDIRIAPDGSSVRTLSILMHSPFSSQRLVTREPCSSFYNYCTNPGSPRICGPGMLPASARPSMEPRLSAEPPGESLWWCLASSLQKRPH